MMNMSSKQMGNSLQFGDVDFDQSNIEFKKGNRRRLCYSLHFYF